ncbi:TIGR00341 family protein [Halobium salinum]|uniref:TIGR00341 family protein n=1 Tax=Halobium salinum TaxID=1364940 RepID=A0ABD5P6A5_9EURY|nr:TIGR00341 family protein [Halobium salinum]
MRLIKVLVPDGKLSTVLDVLDRENVDFVVTEGVSHDRDAPGDGDDSTTLVEFPLPTQAVGYVLGEIRDAGLDDSEYTVVTSVETAKTRHLQELENRFVAGVEEDDSVAQEEIRAKALGMHRGALTYYALTVFSAIVAAAGLLLDSPAVVVGAMVIAPQVGSALIASVGVALDDRRMVSLGVRDQLLGFAAAIVASLLFGLGLKSGFFIAPSLNVSAVGQINQRISPGLLSVSVAFCAGAAGAFGLATALPVSLVGVMIAAALIPAAAAVGIGIAWGLPGVAAGAFILLVVNAVAVNLAGFVVLWYLGYRPDDWGGDDLPTLLSSYRVSVTTVALLLVLFAGFGGLLVDQIAFDNEVNGAIDDVLEEERYAELELRGVDVELGLVSRFDQQPEVTVTVARPVDESFPALADRLDRAIDDRVEDDVLVSVEYRDRQRSEPTNGDGQNSIGGRAVTGPAYL